MPASPQHIDQQEPRGQTIAAVLARRYLSGPATQRRCRPDLVVADCDRGLAGADCGEPSRRKTITQSLSRIRY